MKPATTRVLLYAAIGAVLLSALLLWSRIDYAYPLSSEYTVMGEDGHARVYFEPFSGTCIDGVVAHAVLASHVVGRVDDGFFVASPNGAIVTYRDRHEWLRRCRQLAASFDGRLQTVSRLRCQEVMIAYSVTVLLTLIWFAGMLRLLCRGTDTIGAGKETRYKGE